MAEVDQLVIELVADTTQFQPAIDSLEKIGAVDAKSADLIRKTNADLAARQKALDGLAASQEKASKGTTTMAQGFEKAGKSINDVVKNIIGGATGTKMEAFFEGINDALKESGVSAEELGRAIQETFEKNKAIDETGTKVKSLRTQLREMKAQLASGQLSSDEFTKLSIKAGELEDRIGDVNLQVRNLASDTQALDGLVQGFQGLTGAVQLAQGSAALLGVEAEELEQVQLRLVALLNISNGLQQIQTLLQRQSAAVTLVSNTQQSLRNALLVAENGLQSKNIVVKGLATVATRALNAAMAANPAGLLVVALGALAGALLAYSSSADDASDSQDELNKKQLESLRIYEQIEKQFSDIREESIRQSVRELTAARARGASAVEIANLEKDIANQKLASAIASRATLGAEINDIETLRQRYIDLQVQLQVASENGAGEKRIGSIQTELDLVSAQIATYTRLNNAVEDAKDAVVTAEANISRAKEEAAKKEQEQAEARRKAQRDLTLQRLEDEKAGIQVLLNEVKIGTDEELRLKQALLQKQAQIDLFSLEGTKNTEAQRLLIISNTNKLASDNRIAFEKETVQKIFEQQQKLGQTDVNNLQAQLDQAKEGSITQLQVQKDLIEAQADLEKNAAQQKFELSDKSVEDQRLFQSEILKIDSEAYKAKADLDAAYNEKIEASRQKDLEAEQAKWDQYEQIAFQVLQSVGDAFFEAEFKRLQESENAQLKSLEKRKNTELSNKRLTDKQKLEIEEKYRKEEAQIKLKAWQAEQDAKLSQAIMNVALGVTAALATGPPQGYFLAALTAALGLIEVTKIATEKPPQFAMGVERLRGPGTQTSDSIPAMLSRDERVVSARTNLDYYPALTVIHNRKLPPKVVNDLLTGADTLSLGKMKMKGVSDSMMARSLILGSRDFDYDRAGRTIADHLYGDLDLLNDTLKSTGKTQAELLSLLVNKSGATSQNLRYRR